MIEAFRPQVSANLYSSREYNFKQRFASFWHQWDEVLDLRPGTVLEVGPGAGLVTGLLQGAGVEVTTLDVDPALRPDLVASVTEIPLEDRSVDVALCSEVLEHLPWDAAAQALRELARVVRIGAVVSAPDNSPYWGIPLPLYFGRYVERLRRHRRKGALLLALKRQLRWRDLLWLTLVPRSWSREQPRIVEPRFVPIPHVPWHHEFNGEHHWELGTSGYPVSRLTAELGAAGFRVVRDFRVPEHPWHHFFVLRRAGSGA